MKKRDVNPLDREVGELNERIGEAQKKLELLTENRDVVERLMQACQVSTVCTFCDRVTLWIEQNDLTKARTVLGKLKLRSKLATAADSLAVFVDTECPGIALAYYRRAPDPAHSRCQIVTEERVEKHTYHTLVCPN